jgi:hypothetical protein
MLPSSHCEGQCEGQATVHVTRSILVRWYMVQDYVVYLMVIGVSKGDQCGCGGLQVRV